MRIVGEFEIHRPAVVETILNLGEDLVVGQIRQEREAALGDAHGNGSGNEGQGAVAIHIATAGVGAKSG
jgi:hypothetical protein